MAPPVRVRVAPSPTGDPHVGTAYMSLFNLAFARQQGGAFILRIEDTDRGRYVDSSERQIFDSLRWLGLDWDEGPDKGGPFGPYRQSERVPIYQRYARQLLEAGHAYECWCSPERLAAMRAEQQRRKLPTGYDRLCLGKTRAERAREPGFTEHSVIRMLIPEHPPLEFFDLIRGPIKAPMPDDQVILKADGFPTYHLAVVVDDHLQEISHVTRGEEWISSTPKQLLLYQWLGWPAPQWAHFPLLRNPDHTKISKRRNPAARLLWFREQGFLPEALLNFLALMGWSMPDGREKFTFDDLVEHFAWDRFSPVGPVFDLAKLEWLDGKYIEELPEDELLRRARPLLPGPDQERALAVLAPELKTRLKKLSEIGDQVDYLYVGELDLDRQLLLKQGLDADGALQALTVAQHLARTVEPFEPAALEAAFTAERERREWKARAFFMTLRVALTGKTVTPPLFAVMAALGRERTLARLADAERVVESVHA
jgi:glutamyl-tRNA synthetase